MKGLTKEDEYELVSSFDGDVQMARNVIWDSIPDEVEN